jgi:hypothetical protein
MLYCKYEAYLVNVKFSFISLFLSSDVCFAASNNERDFTLVDDKEFTKQRREEAVTRNQERAEVSAKEKAEKKRENEKYAMNEMMKVSL